MQKSSYYTTAEVAERYGVNPRTVQYWLKTGDLRGERAGIRSKSHWRISQEALDEFDAKRAAVSQPDQS